MLLDEYPLNDELPSEYADRLGIEYHKTVTEDHKKQNGQFFTPAVIAHFMAGFVKTNLRRIKILDPGCGLAILACSLTEKIAQNFNYVDEIMLTVFENDTQIIPIAEKVLLKLQEWLQQRNIHLTYLLCANDFILHNSSLLNNEEFLEEKFDIVIANPPYFKIPKNSPHAVAAKSIIYGQTNIYSIFLVIAAKLLNNDGQLIFITPRSFCSGSYFRLFIEVFFSLVELKNIHIFRSRKDAFLRDQVLQENIIIVAKKIQEQHASQINIPFANEGNLVEISTSKGMADINSLTKRIYLNDDILDLKSPQKILHIPSSEIDDRVIDLFKSWQDSLSDFNISISTGPVVDFRSSQFISTEYRTGHVPLIWLHNITPMEFLWPARKISKGKEKGQYIKYDEKSQSRLIPNKNYVFLRRFSSKDDKSRLVASPYLSNWLPEYEMLGIENHLNYISIAL